MAKKLIYSQAPAPSAREARRLSLVLLVSLQLAAATAARTPRLSRTPPARRGLALHLYPRGGHAAGVAGASSSISRRSIFQRDPPRSVQTVGFRRRSSAATATRVLEPEEERPDYYDPRTGGNDDEYTLEALEELRAQLGPVALFVSNSIELVVVTAGSYISGGVLGYLGGGLMGAPSTLLGKEVGGLVARLSALHGRALASCKSWAALSAAFSGFHGLARLCRGGVEDRWNAFWGSAMSGAFLNRAGGTRAMLNGGLTYAGFSYFLDRFLAPPSPPGRARHQSSELYYNDIPVDD